MSKQAPSWAGPYQSCPQHRENSHDSTLQQAPRSHCRNCRDLTNMLITCRPGLDLFKVSKKRQGKGRMWTEPLT